MSAEAAAARPNSSAVDYSHVEDLLTQRVNAKGKEVPATDPRKRILEAIKRIWIENEQLGLFRIEFNGNSAKRYHLLTTARKTEWLGLKGRIEEGVFSRITTEIVDHIGEPCEILRCERATSVDLIARVRETRSDLVRQIYTLNKGNDCVIAFKGTSTPLERERFFQELFSPKVFSDWKNARLLLEFGSLYGVEGQGDTFTISVDIEQRVRAKELHGILHQLYTTSFEQLNELVQHQFRDQSIPTPNGSLQIGAFLLSKLASPELS